MEIILVRERFDISLTPALTLSLSQRERGLSGYLG